MPISKAKIAKEWGSNFKALADKDAKIAALETEIHVLKMKNGQLLDDENDSYTNLEKNIIENAELKVRNEFLTKKCANLEVRSSESNDTLGKIKGKLIERLGKSGYKKFMNIEVDSNDATSNKISAALENPKLSTNSNSKSKSKSSKRSNNEANSNPPSSTPKKNCGSKSIDDDLSKSFEKAAIADDYKSELVSLVAFILYGFALANEGNTSIVSKVESCLKLARTGREKVEKNRHWTSIDAIFCDIIEHFKEMINSIQNLEMARKVLSRVHNLPKNSTLPNIKNFKYIQDEFFVKVNKKGSKTAPQLTSSAAIEKAIEKMPSNDIFYSDSNNNNNNNDNAADNRSRSLTRGNKSDKRSSKRSSTRRSVRDNDENDRNIPNSSSFRN